VFWQHWAVYWSYSIVAVFIAMLILAIAIGGPLTRAIFENRVAVFLGAISYSIYLWHFPVGTWVTQSIDMASMTIGPFLLITLPLIVAVSAASYFLFERPFLRR